MDELLQFVLKNGLGGGIIVLAFYFVRWGFPAWREVEHAHQTKLAKMAAEARTDFLEEGKANRADFLEELQANRAAGAALTKTLVELLKERQ